MMKRRVSTLLFAVVGMLLLSAMAAYACTNLATLNLSQTNGAPGASVDVTGSAFWTGDDVQPVQIRWNSAEGPVLAEVEPDNTGAIGTSVTIPSDAAPGHHVVVATQMEGEEDDLAPVMGTPVRASFLIGGGVNEPAEISESAGASAVVTPEASVPSGLIALAALLTLAGIGLFGAGAGLFVRESRRRRAEQVAPIGNE